MRITILNSKCFFNGKEVSVSGLLQQELSKYLACYRVRNFHKGKTSRCQRAYNILNHECYFQGNNTLCCFPLVLKIIKQNSSDETYFNQVCTFKSHLSSLAKCQGKTGFDILLPHVFKQPGVQLHPSKQKSILKQSCGLLSTWLASGYLMQIYLMYRFSDSTRGSKYLYHPHWLPWKDAKISQHPKLAPESQPTQSAFHF